jgi:peptide chain release factor 2
VESTSPSNVLDGDLDEFMEASLSQRIEGGSGEVVADLE